MARSYQTRLPPPYLKRVWYAPPVGMDRSAYPQFLPWLRSGEFELSFDRPVTIIVGEDGVGKSTLLEGIAVLAGFDESGGGGRAIERSTIRGRSKPAAVALRSH